MDKFYCPKCKGELDMSDIEIAGINTASLSFSNFHKQCMKYNSFLIFESKTKTFRKLSWFERWMDNRFGVRMEVRKAKKKPGG